MDEPGECVDQESEEEEQEIERRSPKPYFASDLVVVDLRHRQLSNFWERGFMSRCVVTKYVLHRMMSLAGNWHNPGTKSEIGFVFMGKNQNTLSLLAGMNIKRGMGVATSIQAFSLEDTPRHAAGIFTSIPTPGVK